MSTPRTLYTKQRNRKLWCWAVLIAAPLLASACHCNLGREVSDWKVRRTCPHIESPSWISTTAATPAPASSWR